MQQRIRLSPYFQRARLSPYFQGVRLSPSYLRITLSPSSFALLSEHEPTLATMTWSAGLDKDCWATTAFHACPMAEAVGVVDAGSAAAAVLLW